LITHAPVDQVNLAGLAREDGPTMVALGDISLNARKRTAVVIAQKGLPFTAADKAMELGQAVLADITGGKPPDVKASRALSNRAASKDCSEHEKEACLHGAAVLRRIAALTTAVNNGEARRHRYATALLSPHSSLARHRRNRG
jgi:hypothetical protein